MAGGGRRTGEAAMEEWAADEAERQKRVAAIQKKRTDMHRRHLQRFMPELGELEVGSS